MLSPPCIPIDTMRTLEGLSIWVAGAGSIEDTIYVGMQCGCDVLNYHDTMYLDQLSGSSSKKSFELLYQQNPFQVPMAVMMHCGRYLQKDRINSFERVDRNHMCLAFTLHIHLSHSTECY